MTPPTWDYQHGYPGATPPGGIIPLARPLYPPDAASRGKKPSSDGPDSEGWRRGLWRGGRIPADWATGKNKRKWSNTLAHGSPGGNVGESGAAGYQRQMKIDDTGWWGTESAKSIQYALIPAGLPHAGEHLLDDYARALLWTAVELFKGPSGTVRDAALAEAKTYLGYTESPAGTNCNMFGAWYGMNYQPWCAMAVTYWYELGHDGGSPSFVKGSRYHYCPTIVDDAQNNRHGLSLTSDPIPGDVVVYAWQDGDQVYDHVGLFEDGDTNSWQAIEGNTSVDNQSNGGEVMRRSRTRSQTARVAFVRVAEP
jgi:hypothetical protein